MQDIVKDNVQEAAQKKIYDIEAKTILTPQNGFSIYRGVHGTCMVDPSRAVSRGNAALTDGIGVKRNADVLLENALRKKKNRGMLVTGVMSEPYNEAEEQLGILRKCLKVIERYDYGITIRTGSTGVLRDIDVLKGISKKTKCVVIIPLCSMDEELFTRIEGTKLEDRLQTIKELVRNGIPVELSLEPLIPMINDTEENIDKILHFAYDAGVTMINDRDLRTNLPRGTREFFYEMLEKRFPEVQKGFMSTYGYATELVMPEKEIIFRKIRNFCLEHHMMCDKVEIADFKRRYENETESVQMDFMALLQEEE